jgi:hypothetical protein
MRARDDYRRGTYMPFLRGRRVSAHGAAAAATDLDRATRILRASRRGEWLVVIDATRSRLAELKAGPSKAQRLQLIAVNAGLAALVQEAARSAANSRRRPIAGRSAPQCGDCPSHYPQ